MTNFSFPEYARCVDANYMKKVFQETLPDFKDGLARIVRVAVIRSIVRPGKRCDLVYGLGYHLPESKEIKKLYLSARLYPSETSEKYFHEFKSQPITKPEIGPGIYFIKELNLIVWTFPNDPGLPALSLLMNAEKLGNYFKSMGKNGFFQFNHKKNPVQIRIVKYVPQGRCTIRYCSSSNVEKGNELPEATAFAKIYQSKISAKNIYEVIERLYNSPLQQKQIWRIPRPLYLDVKGNWFLMEGLTGEHIEVKEANGELSYIIRRCAEGLAYLQQTDLPLREIRLPAGEILGFQKGLSNLKKMLAHQETDIQKLHHLITSAFGEKQDFPLVPNHGAFRLSQILVDHHTPGLVDFDGMILAHPLTDVASFIAHLLYLQVKGTIREQEAVLLSRTFLNAYREKVSWENRLEQLAAFVAMQLVGKHAKKIVKQGKGDQKLCSELVKISLRILSQPGEFL